MNPSSKVWIYQSNREFTPEEMLIINSQMSEFVENWQAHGAPLNGEYRVIEYLFIVLLVDESSHAASGCSIDSSVGVIKRLENELGLSLTDKSKVAYETPKGIRMVDFREIKDLVTQKELEEDTIVFDNSVTNLATFTSSWKTPAKDTWLKRYFKS